MLGGSGSGSGGGCLYWVCPRDGRVVPTFGNIWMMATLNLFGWSILVTDLLRTRSVYYVTGSLYSGGEYCRCLVGQLSRLSPTFLSVTY